MPFNRRPTVTDLEYRIVELKRWYMPIALNPIYHNNKLKSMRKLLLILKLYDRQEFQKLASIDDITRCALTLLYYFGMRLRLNNATSNYFTRRSSKRQFLIAETVFQKTLYTLLPERSEATIAIIITFFADVSLWRCEDFVAKMLKIVLNMTPNETTLFHMVLSDDDFLDDVSRTRHRIGVLLKLLDCEHIIFEKRNLVFPLLNRLLDYYAYELYDDPKLHYNFNLTKGFEACLYRILERVHDQHRLLIITTLMQWFSSLAINDDNILKVSGIMLRAVALYKVGSFSESLPNYLIDTVLNNLLVSPNPLLNLFGCRVIVQFIDRHHNASHIVEPKLYYEGTKTSLKVGPCKNIDQLFVRHHGGKFDRYFMMGLRAHCEHIANMKAMFSVLCCYVLEVPCGVTAAAAACTMMFMQDFALNEEDISPRSRNWIHAVVISVMSLICWVHKAPVLRLYVNRIITRRANEAPHLNPPLLQEYNVKRLKPWTRKTLFFEDWEMRYGLWKAFEIPPGNILALGFTHLVLVLTIVILHVALLTVTFFLVHIIRHMENMSTEQHRTSRVGF